MFVPLGIPVCPICGIVCAVALAALGAFALAERTRYTPVYQDVFCLPSTTSISNVGLTPIKITINIDVVVTNPNVYELTVVPNGRGRVLLGPERLEYGTVIARGSRIPASGGDSPASGVFVLQVDIEVSFFQSITLMSTILSGKFLVYFELRTKVIIEPSLMGVQATSVEVPVSEQCGLEMQILPTAKIGDAVCGTNLSSLVVPPLEAVSPDTLGFAPVLREETLSGAEGIRDAFCLTISSLCFALSLSLVCCAGRLCYRDRQKSRQSSTAVVVGTSGGPSVPAATMVGHPRS